MNNQQRLIASLDEDAGAAAAGGKADNLRRLRAHGFRVPPGFVITNAARERYLEDPDAIWDAVLQPYRSLNCLTVIVRSSALGEDSSAASFAGQLDSFPGIRDEAHLRRAIVDCWASRWSDRVQAYERARDTTLDGMGVIVQEQIDSSMSGVLFTRAPNGPNDTMLVEYCPGAGEALVSGRVNPGRVALARSGESWQVLAECESGGGPLSSEVLAELAHVGRHAEAVFGGPQDIEWTLDAAGCLWVVQTRPITTSRSAFDKPVPSEPSVLSPSTADGRTRVRWSNANVNENFPQPICPLLYSVASAGYYHYFRNLGRAFGISRRRLARIEDPLRQIIGVHGGRMYYNLTSIHRVLRAAPFGESLTQAFNGFVGTSDVTSASPQSGDTARRLSRATQAFELVWIAIKTTWQFAFVTRRVTRFEKTVDAFAAATRPEDLAQKTSLELRDDLRGFLSIRVGRWTDASLADAASMVCYGALGRVLGSAFPGADQAALHNTLLKALPGLVSSMPAVELWALSQMIRADDRLARLFADGEPGTVLQAIDTRPEFVSFKTALDAYVEQWGFRCSGELMLTTPSFQEDRTPLVSILRSYVTSYSQAGGDSPEQLLKRQEADRLRETSRVLRELRRRSFPRWLPLVRLSLVVRVLLAWTQRSIQLRERARLKQALLYSRLRRIALAIGDRLTAERRLETRDDIFMLTIDEIDALLSGAAMFPDHMRPLVALRRAAHAEFRTMPPPPDAFTLDEGAYLSLAATVRADVQEAGTLEMHGTGACGGRVHARATVLADVTESDLLEPGDVLVTKQTDPGWGPVFPLIAGLVIERGGMLSHGAIIAREFGIPSVVGVRDATRLIPTGSVISIDGDRGVVRLCGPGL